MIILPILPYLKILLFLYQLIFHEFYLSDIQYKPALRQPFAVAEAYPDLKANTNFMQLQATLEDTENKVSYARQSYNDCVLSYNNAIQTFPAVIFAGIFQFKERQGFEAAEAARQAPTVKF